MAIGRYLDLSTAHLTETEMQEISTAPPRVIVNEYGAWVHVNQEAEFEEDVEADADWDDFPNLLAVVRHARSLGDDIHWINFDRDAEEVEGLPVFEWGAPPRNPADEEDARLIRKTHDDEPEVWP